MNDAKYYVQKFLKLRRDGIPGRWPRSTANEAPHKPLLLIAIADGYIAETHAANFIELSESLENRFQEYWSLILDRPRKSTVALPFYHLKNDGFWHLVALEAGGKDIPTSSRKALPALKMVVSGATLDEELHNLFSTPRWADHLRSVLITTYFSPELHATFFRKL
jgi:predicted restriction endonuclease